MHSDGNDRPQLHTIGRYVTTHTRHFLQQSDYTVCRSFSDGSDWRYASHELPLTASPAGPEPAFEPDLLWRFNIPWAERSLVLPMLDDYNLNAFSLFASEESLMERAARRAFRALGLSIDAL